MIIFIFVVMGEYACTRDCMAKDEKQKAISHERF